MDHLTTILAEAIALNKRLVEIAALMARQEMPDDEPWVGTSTAVEQLGDAFGGVKLLNDIKSGHLKYGTHYIDISNGGRPNYAFKVSALRKLYTTPPEKRRTYPLRVVG